MKNIALGTIALALVATAALAADPMAGVVGNTLVSTAPDGTVAKIKMMGDKTYAGSDSKGTTLSGTWDVSGTDEVCFMAKEPAPAAGQEKRCGPGFAGKKPGDSWETNDAVEGTMKMSIEAGQ